MKKFLLGLGILLAGLTAAVGGNSVKVVAEDEVPESTLVCNTYYLEEGERVADEKHTRGDVLVTIEEGKAGDEVSALVKCNPGFERNGTELKTFKYLVANVYFNDVEVFGEDGKYTLTLIAGENKLDVVFDGIGDITIKDLKTVDWLSFLTVENLLTVISYVIMIGLSSGFFITLLKNKKIKNETVKSCVSAIKEVGESSVGEAVQKFVEEQLKPVLSKMSDQYLVIANEMETLIKCFMLSQEDTPEARLAITEELMKMETADSELGDKVKELIESLIKEKEEKKETTKEAIAEVKEAIEELGSEEESTKGLI